MGLVIGDLLRTQPYPLTGTLPTLSTPKRPPQSGLVQVGFWEVAGIDTDKRAWSQLCD